MVFLTLSSTPFPVLALEFTGKVVGVADSDILVAPPAVAILSLTRPHGRPSLSGTDSVGIEAEGDFAEGQGVSTG